MRLSEDDKKGIAKLVGKLRERQWTHGPVAYWGAVDDKKEVSIAENTACHAGLSAWGWGGSFLKKPKFIASRLMWENNPHYPLPTNVIDDYLKWLTTYSPYRAAFVKKGGAAVRKYGYVVVRTDIPANFMAGALFAHRAVTEHFGSYALCWWHLKEQGLHPDLAFCHAHQIFSSDHVHVDIPSQKGWHVAWNANADKNAINNFKKGFFVQPLQNYVDGKQYMPVQALWGDTHRGNKDAEIKQVMKAVAEGGHVKPVINPFKAGNMGQKRTPLIPFIKLWAPMLIKEYANV
jgi:hypothetical protein